MQGFEDSKHLPSRMFWYQSMNFGDALNSRLLPHYGISVVHSEIAKAELVGIGSILDLVPDLFSGTILGAGLMWKNSLKNFSGANCQLIRGKLSAQRCKGCEAAQIGDPGLLVRKLCCPRRTKEFSLGLIPHYIDATNFEVHRLAEKYPKEVTIIDINGSTDDVINSISECENIASSSLHGLIAADALGVPNIWLELSDKVLGHGFKFHDYYSIFEDRKSSTRHPVQVNADSTLKTILNQAVLPPADVESIIERLDELFRGLPS